MKNILILGYGEMGHAMESLLGPHHHLSIWDKYPDKSLVPANLDQSASSADFVLFCLPVNPHREVAEYLAPQLQSHCICATIAKGLDENGDPAVKIFSDIFGSKQPYALIYGPMISEEIRAQRFAFAEIACNINSACDQVHELFTDTRLITRNNTDITGINWSVILKNVYAILFGICDELQLGDNVRGFLAMASLNEMSDIVTMLGGNKNTPYSLAGIGDLITTATSENSHHHEIGRKLARGDLKDINGEGVHTVAMINKHQLFDHRRFPLFSIVQNAIKSPGDVRNVFENYMVTYQ